MKKSRLLGTVCACVLTFITSLANAFSITMSGSVTALTDISQISSINRTVDFDTGYTGTLLDPNYFTGITFHSKGLTSILPGSTTSGSSTFPSMLDTSSYFPGPIAGGGTISGTQNFHAGVVTFDGTVTQFGLTAGRNGTQYITAWDTLGNMLGQVTWTPNSDSSFVGIDTGGVAIGMLSYGNDDLWNGAAYSFGGDTIMSDNWVWSSVVPVPAAFWLFGSGLLGLVGIARRKKA